jgi:hypothetical protein
MYLQHRQNVMSPDAIAGRQWIPGEKGGFTSRVFGLNFVPGW